MKIKKQTHKNIKLFHSPAPPEQGGIVGMKDGVICEYIHDNTILKTDMAVYVPNTEFLNNCIAKWHDEGIDFCGMVHSHPAGQNELSSGDIEYIEKLYQANPQLDVLYFPLVIGEYDLIAYAVNMLGGQLVIHKEIVEIVE